jgi:hypothetical protein
VNADYLRWLQTLPCNRRQARSWVGVRSQYDYEVERFDQWQRRLLEGDASRGAFARLLQWLS